VVGRHPDPAAAERGGPAEQVRRRSEIPVRAVLKRDRDADGGGAVEQPTVATWDLPPLSYPEPGFGWPDP
jgi:hypothetical protein